MITVWIVASAVLALVRPNGFNFPLFFGPFGVLFGLVLIFVRNEFAEDYNDRVGAHRWMEFLGPSRYSARSLLLPALGMIFIGMIFIVTGVARLR